MDLIFPKQCINCGAHGAYLCSRCRKFILQKERQTCYQCGQYSDGGMLCGACSRTWFLDGVIIVSDKNDLLSYMIHKYKYSFVEGLGATLADKMGYCISYQLTTNENWAIVPMPLHKKRQKWRGYNQCEIFATNLSRVLSIPIDRSLIRIRHTKPQMELSKSERNHNISGAFAYEGAPTMKRALLIDDVITTGSTMNEGARALKQAGYCEVCAVALSRGT